MAALEVGAEEVRRFIADNGGKVTNVDLAKHFKKYLYGPDRQEAKLQFKDLVNAVATVRQEDGVRYVILKKDFAEKNRHDSSSSSITSTSSAATESNGFHSRSERAASVPTWNQKSPFRSSSDIVHSFSSPCIGGSNDLQVNVSVESAHMMSTPQSVLPSGLWSPDLPPGHTPQPPPRRKNSARGRENRGAKFEESMKQLSEEKENQDSPRQEEIKDIVSPGSVKEKALKLNRMASEVDLAPKCVANGSAQVSGRRKDHRSDKNSEDDDTCSVSTLDPKRKEWMIKASRADYHGLLKLLREEPKLASCKDFNSYTALHWAAKHGSLDIIKLIAGTHKVNANSKTSGGYTPLHLAAMFGREEIMEVLINTYGADPTMRDYSGKRPVQYLPVVQAQRFQTLFPEILINGKVAGLRAEKDVGFQRIGSLNSKVKKTAVFSGGKALTRMKSWGSADNIQRDRNLMPPPKFFPKKKKSRKHAEYLGASDSSRGRSGDSDSDSAGMTS